MSGRPSPKRRSVAQPRGNFGRCFSHRWLHLDYRNSGGRRNKVEVTPLGLVQQGPHLYLVCRYRGYNNERNLAQHRILSAEMSTLTFDRPKEFDLKKYDDDGRFGFGKGEKIRLTFRIERAAGLLLLETPCPPTSKQSNWMTDGWKSPPRWWIAPCWSGGCEGLRMRSPICRNARQSRLRKGDAHQGYLCF